MRLVQFSASNALGSTGFGAGVQLEDGSVVPVTEILGSGAPATLRELIGAGPDVLDTLRRKQSGSLNSLPEQSVRLMAPIGGDALLLCAGMNYRSHLEEMGDELPEKAAWFIKNSRSIAGPGDAIRLPSSAPDAVDWEGEVVIVFGRECFEADAEDAWDYIAGYTLLNDVSARDWVPAVQAARTAMNGRLAWMDNLLGKQYPTFAPMGPAIVTADSFEDVDDVRLTTTVNGEKVQDALLGDLAVGIPALIEQFSRYYRFAPGDVLSTGTPAGVGVGQKPPKYLSDGDVVTVAATGIGELTNPVTGTK